jgi:tetratricopeptide (TPR) repeat protein
MIAKLTVDERASLHRFLLEYFDLTELKNLAFDLGVDYELFPHGNKSDFSRELISYFERRNNLSCLVQQIISLRDDSELIGILARLPPCAPRSKVQIIGRGTPADLPPELLAKLAEWAGTKTDDVEFIKGVQGSVHLLFSLPERVLITLTQRASHESEPLALTPFSLLDELSQNAWRTVCAYLPISKFELLHIPLHWNYLLSLIKQSKLNLQKAQTSFGERSAFHYYAGVILLKMGRGTAAIKSFNDALVVTPASALAYLYRGITYESLGRYDDALRDYEKALKLDQTFLEGYISRGAAYARNHQLGKALNDFTRAIQLSPKFAVSYHNRGGILYRLRRYDEALDDFDQSLRLNAKDKRTYFGRALTLAKLGRDEDAIKDFTKVVELDPKDARAYIDRGMIYKRVGLYEEALHDFDLARELGDTRAEKLIYEVRAGLGELEPGAFETGRPHFEHATATAGRDQELDEPVSEQSED